MHPVQSLVPAVLAELMQHGPLTQGKLEVAWRAVVGDALSRVTSVCVPSPAVVEVRAADLRWQREVRRSSPVILRRLQSLLGKDAVTKLVVGDVNIRTHA